MKSSYDDLMRSVHKRLENFVNQVVSENEKEGTEEQAVGICSSACP